MFGRLYKLAYHDFDGGDPAYSPRKAEFIAEDLVSGSVYYVYASEWKGIVDGYVTWTVIVAMEAQMDEAELEEVCFAVGNRIHLRGKTEVAPLAGEQDCLKRWKAGLSRGGNGRVVETGSLKQVEEKLLAVGAKLKLKECDELMEIIL